MELVNRVIREAEKTTKLWLVAEKIRPLPEDVCPSEEFLARTRLRLLELPAGGDSSERQAA